MHWKKMTLNTIILPVCIVLDFSVIIFLKIRPHISVADPGFPRGGGTNPQGGGANLLFSQKFPKNCMKMKEFGPTQGDAHPWHPPPP